VKNVYLILTTILVTACSTVEFVRKDFTPHRQGVFRSSTTASESRQAKDREEINQKAKEFCGGEFTVTKEYQALEPTRTTAGVGAGLGMGIGTNSAFMLGSSTATERMFNFVEFVCK
jgi:hypothetical protein